MSIILYIVLAILVLMLMIMIHELGHYLAGKLLKFKIEEFSIGFGKALFSKKMKSGEIFSVRLVPLGGYCAFKGEDEDGNEEPDCFNSYPCWKRIIVLICGALFNFISAIIFSMILLMSVGSGICKVADIVSTNGNEDVIQKGDIILEVDGETPTFINGGIVNLMKDKKADEEIILTIKRDGEIKEVTVKKYEKFKTDDNGNFIDKDGNIIENDDDKVLEGTIIGINTEYVKYSFGEALVNCVPYTFNMAWECLCIIGDLFTGKVGIESIGGPITTVQTIAVSTQANFKNLLLLFPLIAVNLAVFNLLPVPALDGARVLFVAIEWIFKKPVPRKIEGRIHSIGLILLFTLVIVVDILHLVLF